MKRYVIDFGGGPAKASPLSRTFKLRVPRFSAKCVCCDAKTTATQAVVPEGADRLWTSGVPIPVCGACTKHFDGAPGAGLELLASVAGILVLPVLLGLLSGNVWWIGAGVLAAVVGAVILADRLHVRAERKLAAERHFPMSFSASWSTIIVTGNHRLAVELLALNPGSRHAEDGKPEPDDKAEAAPYVEVVDLDEATGALHVPHALGQVAPLVRSMPFLIQSNQRDVSLGRSVLRLTCAIPRAQFSITFDDPSDELDLRGEWTVPGSVDGEQLASTFADHFGVPRPQPAVPGVGKRAEAAIAVRVRRTGTDLTRLANGSFTRDPGGWTAMKVLFHDGEGPELYLNVNLVGGVGEFSDKRPDQAAAIAKLLMRELHDALEIGPPVAPPLGESGEETPWALTKRLFALGKPRSEVVSALLARGLPAEDIELLLRD